MLFPSFAMACFWLVVHAVLHPMQTVQAIKDVRQEILEDEEEGEGKGKRTSPPTSKVAEKI